MGGRMARIRWLGHAAFELESAGKTVLFDPWLTNPKSPVKPEEVSADVVLVTHDHSDHLGEAIQICKRTGAVFVAIYELATHVSKEGIETIGMNIGGTVEARGIKITAVPAFHSAERGNPMGFVVDTGEVKVYHAGDTGLFGDMALIGELYSPDIALLPIGSVFTMSPLEAAKAVELLKPKIAIPMHYGTFPIIEQDPKEFERLVAQRSPETRVIIAEPGKWIELGV